MFTGYTIVPLFFSIGLLVAYGLGNNSLEYEHQQVGR